MTASIGLDIGGANLKAAHSGGVVRSSPFPLWKHPERLNEALEALLAELPSAPTLAVTMTGELCDCFPSKRVGVEHILSAVESIAKGGTLRVWSIGDGLVPVEVARRNPLSVAAGNWHVLATVVADSVEGTGLLLDMGSTTTDIIPLRQCRVAASGLTDPERLKRGELIYTGLTRSPVCALLGASGATEFFSTMADVRVVLGDIPEQPDNRDTADGRPLAREFSHARLARMVCADEETSTETERLELARRVADEQERLLSEGVSRVCAGLGGLPDVVILSGSGAFILERVVADLGFAGRSRRLSDMWGEAASEAACAVALTRIPSR